MSPMMVETPRRLTWMPPPGAPELAWMVAPGILPCSALSMRRRRRPGQLRRADGRHGVRQVLLLDPGGLTGDDDLFQLERRPARAPRPPYAWPARDASPAAACTRCARTMRFVAPSGAFRVNRPSLPACATICVPETAIVASGSPCSVCALVMRPVIWRTCAVPCLDTQQEEKRDEDTDTCVGPWRLRGGDCVIVR